MKHQDTQHRNLDETPRYPPDPLMKHQDTHVVKEHVKDYK